MKDIKNRRDAGARRRLFVSVAITLAAGTVTAGVMLHHREGGIDAASSSRSLASGLSAIPSANANETATWSDRSVPAASEALRPASSEEREPSPTF